MSFSGFATNLKKVIEQNRALLKKPSHEIPKTGKHKDGKKPIRFQKFSTKRAAIIQYDKEKIAKDIQFRVVILLCVILLFSLLVVFFV